MAFLSMTMEHHFNITICKPAKSIVPLGIRACRKIIPSTCKYYLFLSGRQYCSQTLKKCDVKLWINCGESVGNSIPLQNLWRVLVYTTNMQIVVLYISLTTSIVYLFHFLTKHLPSTHPPPSPSSLLLS